MIPSEMLPIEIPVNIDECLEIDFKTEKKTKRRGVREEYDLDDEMFEILEDENMEVELEPFIENFFIYAGPIEDPKKVLKAHEDALKSIKIKRVKASDYIIDSQNTDPKSFLKQKKMTKNKIIQNSQSKIASENLQNVHCESSKIPAEQKVKNEEILVSENSETKINSCPQNSVNLRNTENSVPKGAIQVNGGGLDGKSEGHRFKMDQKHSALSEHSEKIHEQYNSLDTPGPQNDISCIQEQSPFLAQTKSQVLESKSSSCKQDKNISQRQVSDKINYTPPLIKNPPHSIQKYVSSFSNGNQHVFSEKVSKTGISDGNMIRIKETETLGCISDRPILPHNNENTCSSMQNNSQYTRYIPSNEDDKTNQFMNDSRKQQPERIHPSFGPQNTNKHLEKTTHQKKFTMFDETSEFQQQVSIETVSFSESGDLQNFTSKNCRFGESHQGNVEGKNSSLKSQNTTKTPLYKMSHQEIALSSPKNLIVSNIGKICENASEICISENDHGVNPKNNQKQIPNINLQIKTLDDPALTVDENNVKLDRNYSQQKPVSDVDSVVESKILNDFRSQSNRDPVYLSSSGQNQSFLSENHSTHTFPAQNGSAISVIAKNNKDTIHPNSLNQIGSSQSTENTFDSSFSKNLSQEQETSKESNGHPQTSNTSIAKENVSSDTVKVRTRKTSPFLIEYLLRNKLIKSDPNRSSTQNTVEFFLNELVLQKITPKEQIFNLLLSNDFHCLDTVNLTEKLHDLELELSIYKIKLEEYIQEDMLNSDFYDDLWKFSDISFKTMNLKNYLQKNKLVGEGTLRKDLKNQIDNLFGAKLDQHKHWSLKLIAYKKKVFFNKHMDIITDLERELNI